MVTLANQEEYDSLSGNKLKTNRFLFRKFSQSSEEVPDELIGEPVQLKSVPLYVVYFSKKILLVEEINSEFLTIERIKNSMVKFKGRVDLLPWESRYFNLPELEMLQTTSNLRVISGGKLLKREEI